MAFGHCNATTGLGSSENRRQKKACIMQALSNALNSLLTDLQRHTLPFLAGVVYERLAYECFHGGDSIFMSAFYTSVVIE